MSSWEGFCAIVNESLSRLHRNGECQITADIYYDNGVEVQKVGKAQEQAGFSFPNITFVSGIEKEWEKSVYHFTGCTDPNKYEIASSELLYYLLALEEWKKLYQIECKADNLQLIIYEEIIQDIGCRTGVYKSFATQKGMEGIDDEKRLPTESEDGERTCWKKHIFKEENDFNMKKKTPL